MGAVTNEQKACEHEWIFTFPVCVGMLTIALFGLQKIAQMTEARDVIKFNWQILGVNAIAVNYRRSPPKIRSKSRQPKPIPMKENVFSVDLGNMKISDAQRKEINAAVQTAVTGVLARTGISTGAVMFPINKWARGPIWWGIIVRPWKDFGIGDLNEIVK